MTFKRFPLFNIFTRHCSKLYRKTSQESSRPIRGPICIFAKDPYRIENVRFANGSTFSGGRESLMDKLQCRREQKRELCNYGAFNCVTCCGLNRLRWSLVCLWISFGSRELSLPADCIQFLPRNDDARLNLILRDSLSLFNHRAALRFP